MHFTIDRSVWKLCVVVICLLCIGTTALGLLENGGNYGEKTEVDPYAQTGGWFINLGITGLRRKMMFV